MKKIKIILILILSCFFFIACKDEPDHKTKTFADTLIGNWELKAISGGAFEHNWTDIPSSDWDIYSMELKIFNQYEQYGNSLVEYQWWRNDTILKQDGNIILKYESMNGYRIIYMSSLWHELPDYRKYRFNFFNKDGKLFMDLNDDGVAAPLIYRFVKL